MAAALLALAAVAAFSAAGAASSDFHVTTWRWRCSEGQCLRAGQHEDLIGHPEPLYGLDGCKSLCGQFGSLWPQPQNVHLGQKLEPVQLSNDTCCNGFLDKAFELFRQNFEPQKSVSPSSKALAISFDIQSDVLHLDVDTKENYVLKVRTLQRQIQAEISAQTVFGARHGLETLSQLLTVDPLDDQLYIVNEAFIDDEPQFAYRGLLLDTGRNYFDVQSIKRILNGMAKDKLNVLHWHLNEQHSVPFVFESLPELTQFGAYSQEELYYPRDVREIVDYAHARGIIVVPEFDAPAHAMVGWKEMAQAHPEKLGDLVTCAQKEWADGNWSLAAEPPAGQLNPLNEHLYELLEKVYTDLLAAFKSPNQPNGAGIFHMGGDEVNFPCWGTHPDIQKWLLENGYVGNNEVNPQGYLELWGLFQAKAKSILIQANGGKRFKHDQVVWTSELSKAENIERYLPSDDYIIQVWCSGFDNWLGDLLRKSYRIILSNSDAWYLDCGFGAWIFSGEGRDNNWCSPFKGWKTVYSNSPKMLVRNQGFAWDQVKHLVMGGEAAMWSEQVDASAVESRLWPRLSAFAERLWSDPDTIWASAEQRLLQHRRRLVRAGLRPDAIQPEFCRQHDGYCYMPKKKYGEFQAPYMPDDDFRAPSQENTGNDADTSAGEINSLGIRDESYDRASLHTHRKATSQTLWYLTLVIVMMMCCLAWLNRRILIPLLITKLRPFLDRSRSRRFP